MDLVGFTLIIDDIVLPDGQTCMAQLGGGGPQTLFGFQLVSAVLSPQNQPCSVGLAAGVGSDLPEACEVRVMSSWCFQPSSAAAAARLQLHSRGRYCCYSCYSYSCRTRSANGTSCKTASMHYTRFVQYLIIRAPSVPDLHKHMPRCLWCSVFACRSGFTGSTATPVACL
jgi:hypothetical protein